MYVYALTKHSLNTHRYLFEDKNVIHFDYHGNIIPSFFYLLVKVKRENNSTA